MVMFSFVEYCDSRSARYIPGKGAGSGRFFPVWFDSGLAFRGQVPTGINMMGFSSWDGMELKILGLDLEKGLVLGFSRLKSKEVT